MSKFKAGDIVVCVESYIGQIIDGEEYVVVGIKDDLWVKVVRSDCDIVGGYRPNQFKLKEIPQPLTWTMEEIGKVLDDYFYCSSDTDFVIRQLVEMKHKQNPEYNKYLELKEKFEGI
jgi:hypothetical protein